MVRITFLIYAMLISGMRTSPTTNSLKEIEFSDVDDFLQSYPISAVLFYNSNTETKQSIKATAAATLDELDKIGISSRLAILDIKSNPKYVLRMGVEFF